MDFQESDFFSLLSEEERVFVNEKSYKRKYHKNSIIHSPGDKISTINYVLSGRLKIYNISEAGKEIIYRFCGSHSLFGLADTGGDNRREVFAETMEDTQVLCIEQVDFLKLLKSNYELTLFSLQILGNRVRQAHRAIQSLAIQDTNSRLAYLLLKLVNMNKNEGDRSMIPNRLTHQEMASMIGATRTTVTELINDYKAQKYIEYVDGKIKIINFNILNQLAED